MTKNELELINLIRNSEEPEQTLKKAVAIIRDLHSLESSSKQSSETLQTTL